LIRSFKHRGLKRFYEQGDRSGLRSALVDTIQEVLTVLDDALTPHELNPPGYRLHPLKGDMKGFWSVTVRPTGASFFALKETMHLTLKLSITTESKGEAPCR
jgi:proteic killer suppression protein